MTPHPIELRIENRGNTPANMLASIILPASEKNPRGLCCRLKGQPEVPVRQIIFPTNFERTERLGVIAPEWRLLRHNYHAAGRAPIAYHQP